MARPSASDLDIVKRPHQKTDWSEQKLHQLLHSGDDPLYFIENFVRLQHPTRGALPFKPYEFQKRMVLAMQQHRFTIIMAARQCGKSNTFDTIIAKDENQIKIGDLLKISLKEKIINLLESIMLLLAK